LLEAIQNFLNIADSNEAEVARCKSAFSLEEGGAGKMFPKVVTIDFSIPTLL